MATGDRPGLGAQPGEVVVQDARPLRVVRGVQDRQAAPQVRALPAARPVDGPEARPIDALETPNAGGRSPAASVAVAAFHLW